MRLQGAIPRADYRAVTYPNLPLTAEKTKQDGAVHVTLPDAAEALSCWSLVAGIEIDGCGGGTRWTGCEGVVGVGNRARRR